MRYYGDPCCGTFDYLKPRIKARLDDLNHDDNLGKASVDLLCGTPGSRRTSFTVTLQEPWSGQNELLLLLN